MNVLYLLNYAGKAGTERYVELLCRSLSGDGRIKPFFAYHEGGELAETLAGMGVPVRQLSMTSRFDVKAAKQLAALCKEWQIDVLHCHYLRENYIALMAKTWVPRLKIVYTNHFLLPNNWHTRLTNRLLDRRQNAMLAVCEAGKTLLAENGWNEKHIRVVHNGLDPALWAGTKADSKLREELSIPEDRFVILCASRFSPEKGHEFLLRGLKTVKERTKTPFDLVLAGDGDLLEPMKALGKELGLENDLHFLGYRTDMRNLYLGADLFVNASETEALSFMNLEAMAAGLPAVITNVGGNPDIVRGEADGGLLVPYGDSNALADAVTRFLEDPAFRACCAENARARVRDAFTLEGMVEETYRTYRDVLNG